MAATRARIGVVNCQSSRRSRNCAGGHRFEQQGGEFGLGMRRGLELLAIQLEDHRGAVGDGLLVLGR